MSENVTPSPPVWPFVAADVLFLAMAAVILMLGHRPLLWWEACLMTGCGAAAAVSLMTPFLRQGRNELAATQSAGLVNLAGELQKLERLAGHINAATLQWKTFETQSIQSVESAKQLSESLAAESRAFSEFLQKSNDAERAHLRLEVEKLRRAEGDWIQTATHVLDHVFGLFGAAQRTGQRSLIEQLGRFQDACRETVRRMGLTAVVPQTGEAFDERVHQLLDNAAAPGQAVVSEIIATGFTYQGRLIRRALVAVQAPGAPEPPDPSEQNDLPLTAQTGG